MPDCTSDFAHFPICQEKADTLSAIAVKACRQHGYDGKRINRPLLPLPAGRHCDKHPERRRDRQAFPASSESFRPSPDQ